jgi:hypothetical protein
LVTLMARVYDFGDGVMGALLPEKRPLKIGEILMEMECLTRLQLNRVLQKQQGEYKLGHGRTLLGEIMVKSGIVTEEQLLSALEEQRMRRRHQSDQEWTVLPQS